MAGDIDPTKQVEVHMDMVDIKDIYEEYVADIKHFSTFPVNQYWVTIAFAGWFGKRSHMWR